MVTLVRKNLVEEKYALQEIDGKINDLFYKDMESMGKLAYPMLFCLEKYGCMVLSRILMFNKPETFMCSINYIFYDKDNPSYVENASAIVNYKYKNIPVKSHSPKQNVGGFAEKSHVFVYIPVNPTYLPFGRITYLHKNGDVLNGKESKYIIQEISDEYVTGLVSSCLINVSEFASINIKGVLNEFSQPIEELNKYYTSNDLKQKKQLPLTQHELGSYLNILKHELTHVYDTYNGSREVNYFSFTKDYSNVVSLGDLDKSKLNIAIQLLYYLWSKTEFNAFTQSYGDQNIGFKNSERSVKNSPREPERNTTMGRPFSNDIYKPLVSYIKDLSSYISSLEDYNDLEFWDAIKEIASNGSNDKQTKNRINKMSAKEFKTYFVKTSKKQLEKFKEKTIKNSTQQSLYNKDSSILAKEIRKGIDENISKHTYGKKQPFEFNISFLYYFLRESYSYQVVFSINTDSNTYLDTIYSFADKANVSLKCKKANLDFRASYHILNKLDSFFHLYQELVTKQRKSYLDKIAIELADDIRFLLDKKDT